MALHLAVFALLGVGLVVVAWFMAPAPEHVSFVVGTAFGIVGSLLGGFLTLYYWPTTDGQFNSTTIGPALVGAGLLFWAYRSYALFQGAD